jgi:Tol biopolymer transport system component
MVAPGTRLGVYEVVAQIGAGGMGEVYRARDTRLNRDVALKVLPDLFALDPDRLARFKREAQVLASLNHPNIAAIHGLEESGGVWALVLELVEGPTLADRIAQGPVPLDEALPIARQIAEALEAAHEQGIVHRDLKPANIKVRPDGTVKVLDFGLAKAMEGEVAAVGAALGSISPTITSPAATRIGTILGTAAYMSPEQARGKTVDKRSDIWAFGCVLYEMLTGRRAFEGEDVTEALARIIEREPNLSVLPASTPASVHRLLRRCFEKDRRKRLTDAGIARIEIDDATLPSSENTPRVTAQRRFSAYGVALVLAAGVVAGGATAGGAAWWLTRPAPQPVVRLAMSYQGPGSIGAGNAFDADIAISSDGRRIAYVAGDEARARIIVRPLDETRGIDVVPEVTNGVPNEPRSPFFSPDGRWLGFVERVGGARSIRKVSATGGPAVTVSALLGANFNPRGFSWGDDDRIVFATADPQTGLLRVPAGGGPIEVLTKPAAAGEDHLYPEVLPGARAVLYTIARGRPDDAAIAVLDLSTGMSRVLINGGSYARYSPSGHVLYAASGTLRAAPFDLATLQVRGESVAVVDGLVTKTSGAANFSVAANGSLVYAAGPPLGELERTLVWVDRQGREEPVPAPKRAYAYLRLSPTGDRVALDIRDQDNDIWIWHFGRETLTRVTFERGLDMSPVWSADGKRLAFSSLLNGVQNIFSQPSDGSGTAEAVAPSKDPQTPDSFSPDGRWLFFNRPLNGPFDIGVADIQKRTSRLLLHMPYSEANAELSPDGRWLAYSSDESGREETYVRPFPQIDSGRWQISTAGGGRPLWSKDGRELFYFTAPGTVTAVPISSSAGFEAGNPKVLFSGTYSAPNAGRQYDISMDGRRFLIIKAVRPQSEAKELVVVQNWFDELKRLAPAH